MMLLQTKANSNGRGAKRANGNNNEAMPILRKEGIAQSESRRRQVDSGRNLVQLLPELDQLQGSVEKRGRFQNVGRKVDYKVEQARVKRRRNKSDRPVSGMQQMWIVRGWLTQNQFHWQDASIHKDGKRIMCRTFFKIGRDRWCVAFGQGTAGSKDELLELWRRDAETEEERRRVALNAVEIIDQIRDAKAREEDIHSTFLFRR